MSDHDDLEAMLGIDTDDPEYALASHLATEDDDLLEGLVAMRKDKGLTQKQVAERMNRDPSAVSKFETLGADPHLSTIRRYASAVRAKVWHIVADADSNDAIAGADSEKLRSLNAKFYRPGNIIAYVQRDVDPALSPRHGLFDALTAVQSPRVLTSNTDTLNDAIADTYQITALDNGRLKVRFNNDRNDRNDNGDRVDA